MKINKRIITKLLILVSMLTAGLFFYNQLPNTIPTHRNIEWKADNFWSKISIFFIPLITLFMVILFPILSKLDPKKENYEKFSKYWEIMQITIIWFMAYIHFVMIYIILHPTISINFFMLIWLWIFFIMLWNYMWKIRRNYFIWVKTPWTLDNDEVWNKTSRLSGWIFVLSWIIFLAQAFIMKYLLITFIVTIALCITFPFVYSYIIFKNIQNK